MTDPDDIRKDQAAHGRREVDRATFHAWLRTHIFGSEGIIDADTPG